jgi:hypothetical protein
MSANFHKEYFMRTPLDRNSQLVQVDSYVRLQSLSDDWFDSLPTE